MAIIGLWKNAFKRWSLTRNWFLTTAKGPRGNTGMHSAHKKTAKGHFITTTMRYPLFVHSQTVKQAGQGGKIHARRGKGGYKHANNETTCIDLPTCVTPLGSLFFLVVTTINLIKYLDLIKYLA